MLLERVDKFVKEIMKEGWPAKDELEGKLVLKATSAGGKVVKTDENRWRGFTQSKAKINIEIGGQFSIFDGVITGVNMKLEEDKLIMQKWSFQNWHDGEYSTICLTIEEPEIGITVVKLMQTDVLKEDRYGNATVV
ncbi:hypothetical protein GOP47_0003649 [Adiantum capillus-veneris]|uniref:Activator of Hsp90 ATPase homologue 1/2-like C-terminal domain-containing protein n=1 Tax=Adiantum capillus-veneris TaxID=13818 RepID=A0A9D4V714_ADICA|nr:hypothetical protein GOP47_0003649 [Adiantum capillus-veneris]